MAITGEETRAVKTDPFPDCNPIRAGLFRVITNYCTALRCRVYWRALNRAPRQRDGDFSGESCATSLRGGRAVRPICVD